MKILVTGGCGFIGSHIVDAYVEAGHEVIVADKKNSNELSYKNNQATYYQADLTDSKKVNRLVEKIKPDIINHHAANISLVKSIEKPLYDAKNNITAVINLLEAARKYGTKKIIFASSAGALYSTENHLPYTEQTPVDPISPYGVSKLASEHYIKVYSQLFAIQYVILRYSNVYGPRQSLHSLAVIPLFIESFIKNKTLTINNDGKQTRDFLYVSDVQTANLLALRYQANTIFNIASQTQTSIIELIAELKKIFKADIATSYKYKTVMEQKNSYISYQKAKKLLHWRPTITLKSGLENTIEYYKKTV